MSGHVTRPRLCQLLLTMVIMLLIGQVSGKEVQKLSGLNITDDMEDDDMNQTSITMDQHSSITDVMGQQSNVTDDIEENDWNHTSPASPWTNSSEDIEENYFNHTSIPMDERISIKYATTGCGGEFKSYRGVLRHPMSGGTYQNNEECTWIIRAANPINIKFVNFNTENKLDYLVVRDGEIIDSPVLGTLSGENIPPAIKISRNVAHLKFTSDGTITKTGFEIHWQSIGCGGEYNSSSGIIHHPMRGGNYQDNDHCTWIIRAESRIKITFVSFDTYNRYDSLTIRDGERIDSDVLGKFHGRKFSGSEIPRPVQTRTNAAHLLFTSNAGGTKTGFQLYWETLECGGEFNSNSGIIRHPISGNYQNNEDCIWLIKTQAQTYINITFVKFNIERNLDLLYVRDGESNGSDLLGNYTGDTLPPFVQTSKNVAHLHFTSDDTITNLGFELHWHSTVIME